MFGQEVGGFFATRDEEGITSVHLDSQITLALFGWFFHCEALGRRMYSPFTLLAEYWFQNYFKSMEL